MLAKPTTTVEGAEKIIQKIATVKSNEQEAIEAALKRLDDKLDKLSERI